MRLEEKEGFKRKKEQMRENLTALMGNCNVDIVSSRFGTEPEKKTVGLL